MRFERITFNMATFYRVGGWVRDAILRVRSKDVDFAVEAESFDAMRAAIVERGGKIFLETPEFFTIRANVPELGAADYVLARKDGDYTDGRRPDNVEIGTISDDLARRDFTMNAIAMTEDNQLVDPHGGVADIEARIIRAVGSPVKRLGEDKLRAFRAVRFSITKGFSIESALADAIVNLHIEDFDGVSTDRIRDEVMKMFVHDTHQTVMLLTTTYFTLWQTMLKRGIWLKPTSESTK
jgi:tRNA nucleotidyltransferase (CCA-adding enzyme)